VAQKSITSGGGFSVRNSRPSWQDAAVKGYFANASAAGVGPVPGYETNGRGYPDITMAGLNYFVYVGGRVNALSGTSASCPALSGLISNINAGRMRAGKGSIGWINPALYKGGSTFLNDIVSGDIKCAADGTCCDEGFYALPGWDPTSGMGSPNFKKMYDYFLPLGTITATFSSGGARASGTVWCTLPMMAHASTVF
jgi:tripeptidyl-peptidase I